MSDEPRGGEQAGDDQPGDEPSDDGPRLTPITDRDQLPAGERRHFDAIAESRGGVRGPFAVLLHSPELAGRVADLGAYVRFEGELPDDVRELAILATAYEWDCAYEWAAHKPIAREAGLEDGAIDAARSTTGLDELPEVAAVVVRFVRELLRDHDVAAGTYRDAVEAFGDRGLVELVTTLGYYSMLACALNGLRVRPDGQAPF